MIQTITTGALTSTTAAITIQLIPNDNQAVNSTNTNSTVVQYGLTAGYGATSAAQSVPIVIDPITGDNNAFVTAQLGFNLSGLQPGMTYHYRIKATSPDGDAFSTDHSFTLLTELEYWRLTYFGSPANTGIGADGVDADGDGNSNLFEFVAGISPVTSASRFKLRIDAVPGQPGRKAIIFSPRLADRTYAVKAKTSLLTVGGWTGITAQAPDDVGDERTIIDLDASGSVKFYRVEITKP